MNNEQQVFLNLKTIPACLEACQTAWYLGFACMRFRLLWARGCLGPGPFAKASPVVTEFSWDPFKIFPACPLS